MIEIVNLAIAGSGENIVISNVSKLFLAGWFFRFSTRMASLIQGSLGLE